MKFIMLISFSGGKVLNILSLGPFDGFQATHDKCMDKRTIEIVQLLWGTWREIPSVTHGHFLALDVASVQFDDVDLGKIVFLADLRFLLYKYVVKHFDKTLHGVLERQFTIGSEKLQIKIPFRDLVFLENWALVLHDFHHLFLFGDFIQMLQFFQGCRRVNFLLAVNHVFMVKLLKYIGGKLAPKLWEKVAGRKELRFLSLINELVKRRKSSNCHHIVKYHVNFEVK